MPGKHIAAMVAVLIMIGGISVVSAESATADGDPTGATWLATTDGGYVGTFTYANGDSTEVWAPGTSVTVTDDGYGSTQLSNGTTEYYDGTTVSFAGGSTVNTSGITASQEIQAVDIAAPADVIQGFQQFDQETPIATAGSTFKAVEFTPQCFHKDLDNHKIHVDMCDHLWKVNASNGTRYFTSTFLASTYSKDEALIPDLPSGLAAGVHFHADNWIDSWKPRVTSPMGSCTDTTFDFTYQGFGVTSAGKSCPATWGPTQESGGTFKTKWDGQGSGYSGTRSTHGASGWYRSVSGTADRDLKHYVWWVD